MGAKSYGVLDPITFLAKLRGFSQPSEVQEPIELLRAGIVFHARGIINSNVIQYNLDWEWPFWVKRQFNPADPAFLPRGFAISHVNQTNRNWTAVGRPDLSEYPIIDPRGMVTPFFDGWSVDVWLISKDGERLIPSEVDFFEQMLETRGNLAVTSLSIKDHMRLITRTRVSARPERPFLRITARGISAAGGWMAVVLRPCNPEGIQFIEKVAYNDQSGRIRVNDDVEIRFDAAPENFLVSSFSEGDVSHLLPHGKTARSISCSIGMATAAALFPLDGDRESELNIEIPLAADAQKHRSLRTPSKQVWEDALASTAKLHIPDKRLQFLYDAALRTLVLLSADEVVPGPYTYKRFWYRDAVLMIHAMLCAGLMERSRRGLERFFDRQKMTGYFHSQEGEWDSNGQVLWIFDRFDRLCPNGFAAEWIEPLVKGAEWIIAKRTPKTGGKPHSGLLPAGFSAEHLGPNDYYYWDNFWAVAGLKAAARLAERYYPTGKDGRFEMEASDLASTIFQTIEASSHRRNIHGIPASPYRRMDAGAIGSIVADYPIQLTAPKDPAIRGTVEYLMNRCFFKGAFFQDMIHSGLNVYLTLTIAQSLLRSADDRYRELVQTVAGLASSTGQWPEAVHPLTLGGCMGDGQHGWAVAEWVMMIRNLFVREEEDRLIVGSGIFPEWLSEESIGFGPAPTQWGMVSVKIDGKNNRLTLEVRPCASVIRSPAVEICIHGYRRQTVDFRSGDFVLVPEEK